MHEGGHHSLTGISKLDRFLQAIIYGVGDGMSSSWWSSQHNRHHAMPQRIKRDVDLETLPLLAFNSKVVKNPKHGKTFFVQNQVISLKFKLLCESVNLMCNLNLTTFLLF